jgi:succinoglycan biosynthesis transport protein ExoP
MIEISDRNTGPMTLVPHHSPLAVPAPTIVPRGRDQQVIDIHHYVWLLRQHWWKAAIAAIVCTALGGFLSSRFTPVYESVARITVDLKTPAALVGTAPDPGVAASEADQYFNTELQLLQSDLVLRPVAKQFHLVSDAAPRGLPSGMHPSDAPVYLNDLKVTHPPNSFIIQISYRSKNPVLAAEIANAIARSYIVEGRELRVQSSLDESAFMESQIAQLKKNMEDSAAALASHERALGVINPAEKTSLMAARLLQLNAQLTEAQEDRMRKEVDYNAITSGTTAAIQVSPQALALDKLEENVRAAQEKMESVRTIYGTSNLEYKKAANDLEELMRQETALRTGIGQKVQVAYAEALHHENLIHSSLLQTKAESDALNADSSQYEELKREAETNRDLYSELFRKVKEAGINGGFQSNAVRIADPARPQLHPVFPNRNIFMAIGFLVSILGSAIIVLILDVSDRTLRDPEQTREVMDLDVLGVLPHVSKYANLSPLLTGMAPSTQLMKRARNQTLESATFYQESVRSLLSTIQLGHYGRRLRSIVITSAAEGEGKSTCVAHLAAYYSMQGRRTLLIDADLRCPTQHKIFRLEKNRGVSEAISGGVSIDGLRQTVDGLAHLDVIAAGEGGAEQCPSLARAIAQILDQARHRYDMILIDAPPILCFAEPIQLACMADGVVVVCRAGHTSRQAVAGVLNKLSRLGANTLGLVLNHVRPTMSPDYGYYDGYRRHAESRSA